MPKIRPHLITEAGEDFAYVGERIRSQTELESTADIPLTLDEVSCDGTRGNPYKYYKYHVRKTDQEVECVFLDSRVNMGAIMKETNRRPRYMFRVFSELNAGLNSDGLFQSQATMNRTSVPFGDLSYEAIGEYLKSHMESKYFDSPFISFSSSFLWTLRKAYRMREKGAGDVKIAIIDTMDLTPQTLIFYAHALLVAYDIEGKLFMKQMGKAMLLAYGEIKAPMNVVLLDHLLKAGISGLLPHFKKPDQAFQARRCNEQMTSAIPSG